MRLWVRLGVTAALMAGLAIAVVHLRTETSRAGNRLHALYGRKRRLEKACWRLHVAIADLKNVDRLREGAAAFREAGEGVEVLMDPLPELAEPVPRPPEPGPLVPLDPWGAEPGSEPAADPPSPPPVPPVPLGTPAQGPMQLVERSAPPQAPP